MASVETDLVAKDLDEFKKLLPALTGQVKQLRTRVREVTDRITKTSDIQTKNGLSLLDIKIHSLLSYLTNLAFTLLLKTDGHQLEDHPAIDRLIEQRTVLEKLRPLEGKLRYQIDKLVKAATATLEGAQQSAGVAASVGNGAGSGSTGFKDPLAFKPNPFNMTSSTDDSTPAPSTSTTQPKTGTYKAPRVAPQFFDDPSSKKKLSNRDKQKASRSRLMRDIRSQFENAPEELSAEGTGYSAKEMATNIDEQFLEKEKYEEDNFIRLNVTKREKKQREKMERSGGMARFRNEFETFDDFDEIAGLDDGAGPSVGRGGKKRRGDFLDEFVGRSEGGKNGKAGGNKKKRR